MMRDDGTIEEPIGLNDAGILFPSAWTAPWTQAPMQWRYGIPVQVAQYAGYCGA